MLTTDLKSQRFETTPEVASRLLCVCVAGSMLDLTACQAVNACLQAITTTIFPLISWLIQGIAVPTDSQRQQLFGYVGDLSGGQLT